MEESGEQTNVCCLVIKDTKRQLIETGIMRVNLEESAA